MLVVNFSENGIKQMYRKEAQTKKKTKDEIYISIKQTVNRRNTQKSKLALRRKNTQREWYNRYVYVMNIKMNA